MIRINLLPSSQIATHRGVKQEVSIAVLFYVLIGLIMVYVAINLNAQHKELKNRLVSLNTEIAKYRHVERELKDLKKKKQMLKKEIEIISRLQKNRDKAVQLMEALEDNFLVNKMWFDQLSLKNNRLDLKGVALSNESIAEFMTRLKRSPFFPDVELVKTERKKIQGYNLVGFELICAIEYPVKEQK